MSFEKKRVREWKAPSHIQREKESVRMEMHRMLSEIERRGEQEYSLDAVRETAVNLGDEELLSRIEKIKRRMRG